VVANAGASAYRGGLAHAPLAVMLAYLRSTAFLAADLYTIVVANADAPALCARVPLAVMLAYLRSITLLAVALYTA
jgi:hypothetical protein